MDTDVRKVGEGSAEKMREIRQFKTTIDGYAITAYKTRIHNANILEVEAGTTGYRGGDSGHGGRTYFEIMNTAGTDLRVKTDADDWGDASRVKVTVGGDAELTTMIEALEFILQVLKDGAEETIARQG